MHVLLSGLGNTGLHIARQLKAAPPIRSISLYDPDETRVQLAKQAIGRSLEVLDSTLEDMWGSTHEPQVAVLCGPASSQTKLASRLVERGCHVVSISDRPADVEDLLALDEKAKANGVTVAVGAGFCPGLSSLLAAYGANQLDTIDAIGVSTTGTGGPACARQHHWALKNPGAEWTGDSWLLRRGRSGRDLVWFPDLIGAKDCYRAALADPILIHQAFPEARRISARMSANRRDRLTTRLPMLRRPHSDGGLGAIRAEIRGKLDGAVQTLIYGVAEQPSFAAATVAAHSTKMLAKGDLPPGAYGLASFPDPANILLDLHNSGIVVSSFDGYLQSSQVS